MFGSFFRRIINSITTDPRSLVVAAMSAGLCQKSYRLDGQTQPLIDEKLMQSMIRKATKQVKDQYSEMLKQIKEVEVCHSSEIKEGQQKSLTVKDANGKQHQIIIIRLKGTLYALYGTCPYKPPFSQNQERASLFGSVCFNDKLFCPHHGCVFDLRSGSVEHGPSLQNLPKFYVDEKTTKIKVVFPAAIPTKMIPSMQERDLADNRKVVILGGDDYATVGCINGLRQFGYQGDIMIVKQGQFYDPVRKDYFHKAFKNFGKQDQFRQTKNAKSNKNEKKPAQNPSPDKTKSIEQYIQDLWEEKILSKLNFYDRDWYEKHAVNFQMTREPFRIINKRFYPYITFTDGFKMQFDALLIATGMNSKIQKIPSLTVKSMEEDQLKLGSNVFAPVRSRSENLRLNIFLNKYDVKQLMVLGVSAQSLEFLDSLHRQFPSIKLTVLDSQQTTALSDLYGPDIQRRLLKECTDRGMEFYLKVKKAPEFTNQFYDQHKQSKVSIEDPFGLKQQKITKIPLVEQKKYQSSVTAKLTSQVELKADGVIIFSPVHIGNTQNCRKGKYSDIQFTSDGLIETDAYLRSASKRMFAAGSCANPEYFVSHQNIFSWNPLIGYEQGFIAGMNMLGLKIPNYYIPVQFSSFFGKKLLYVGTRQFYDNIAVIGSVEEWDFLAIYSLGENICAVSASPSKEKELQVMREAFRVNSTPLLMQIISGEWTVRLIEKHIRKLNKSGCYKDQIHKNEQNINKKDLLWMERTPDAGYLNDKPLSEELPDVEVNDQGVLKQL